MMKEDSMYSTFRFWLYISNDQETSNNSISEKRHPDQKKQARKYASRSKYSRSRSKFFFDKGKNGSQAAEIVNGIYGADSVTSNYVQFGFHRFRSSIFYVKVVPRTGRPVVENVDKITEIIEVD
ncbi:histone-lysine N-methyltransferase SETMAR [Trichonephila clavipes]|nr:histone-lysine N-methyltransferase SETMAR [Trichonephila clavipes]